MNNEQMKEAYLFYTELQDKNNICFKIYTEFTSTYDKDNENYMDWHRISENIFYEQFSLLQIPLSHEVRENTTFSIYQKF
jgi:hypothetical protein